MVKLSRSTRLHRERSYSRYQISNINTSPSTSRSHLRSVSLNPELCENLADKKQSTRPTNPARSKEITNLHIYIYISTHTSPRSSAITILRPKHTPRAPAYPRLDLARNELDARQCHARWEHTHTRCRVVVKLESVHPAPSRSCCPST